MSKELFMDAWQEIYDKLIEGGCPEDIATELADERAYERMRERLFDMADNARLHAKDGR